MRAPHRRRFSVVVPIVARLSVVLAVGSPLAADTPEEAFSRIARSYRAAGEVAERLEYTVRFPDGREETKSMEYGRVGERAFITLNAADGSRLFHVSAGDGVLRVSQFNVGSAYVEGPFDGSLAEALEIVGGLQVGVTVPPGLAAFEPGEHAFVESFGFNILPGLEVTSAGGDGETESFELGAESGKVSVVADATGRRLRSLHLELGEADSSLRVDATFEPIDVPASDERWSVTTDGRSPVADFAALEASAFPLGQLAPDLEIRDLDGETVTLADLRGRVVILDFWATWCVPCWRALEHLEEVTAWAGASGLPISVFAVDTMEQPSTFEEQRDLAARFLAGRGLELRALIDFDDTFFAGMHSPGLPSTVVIAPDGTLAGFHSGVGDEMAARLEAEAKALLDR